MGHGKLINIGVNCLNLDVTHITADQTHQSIWIKAATAYTARNPLL